MPSCPQASSIVVIYDPETRTQRFFFGHDANVMALVRHPDSDLCATAQWSRPAKICIFDAGEEEPEAISTFSAGPHTSGELENVCTPTNTHTHTQREGDH